MSERVLDSSVHLAVLLNETLRANTDRTIRGSVISSVNLVEVLSRGAELGLESIDIENFLQEVGRIEPFTESQARLAAQLRPQTAHAGLSLGDRACLALAIELGAEVYTADRVWSTLNLPCKIHLVR